MPCRESWRSRSARSAGDRSLVRPDDGTSQVSPRLTRSEAAGVHGSAAQPIRSANGAADPLGFHADVSNCLVCHSPISRGHEAARSRRERPRLIRWSHFLRPPFRKCRQECARAIGESNHEVCASRPRVVNRALTRAAVKSADVQSLRGGSLRARPKARAGSRRTAQVRAQACRLQRVP